MFSAGRAWLLAGVALAAHAALVSGYCTSDSMGDLSGTPVKLADMTLPPPGRSWTVLIPELGNNCIKAGVVMTCCDEEAPPVVHIGSLSRATVERRGPVLVTAAVMTTVYCSLGDLDAPRPHAHAHAHAHGWVP